MQSLDFENDLVWTNRNSSSNIGFIFDATYKCISSKRLTQNKKAK